MSACMRCGAPVDQHGTVVCEICWYKAQIAALVDGYRVLLAYANTIADAPTKEEAIAAARRGIEVADRIEKSLDNAEATAKEYETKIWRAGQLAAFEKAARAVNALYGNPSPDACPDVRHGPSFEAAIGRAERTIRALVPDPESGAEPPTKEATDADARGG